MEPVSLFIAGSVVAAPVVAGLRRLLGWLRGDPTASAHYALGATSEVIAALPAGWERWGGARPELRGAPRNSILAVRGLADHPPIVRATLLDVAEQLGIPVDSLATVIAHESGWKADAKNPLGAYGLIQITKGAHLPGFLGAGSLAAVPLMSAVDQLTQIALPYFARQHVGAGADIGHLAMQNFLPAYASKAEDFVLSRAGENVYEANAGLDLGHKGSITVGDVYESFAQVARAAKGRRIAVDGRILDGGATSATSAPAPRPMATKTPPALPPPAYDAEVTAAGCACDESPTASQDAYRPRITAAGGSARGLLLAAVREGKHKPLAKMELEVPELDLVVTILRDAIQAQVDGRWLRLGVTYNEQIEICRTLGLISPTQEIVTAAWEAARHTERTIQPVGLVQQAADFRWMDSVAFAIRHNDNIERAIAAAGFGPDDFIRPYGKAWIVHPRQVEPDKGGVVRGVVEFGWQLPNGKPIQNAGSGGHDANYMDYSMVAADLCERRARRLSTGETVDLVDEYRVRFPGAAMAELVEVYR